MSWEPIDLAAVGVELRTEILRAAANERVYLGADLYDASERAYRYDEHPDDQYDGSNVTEEVMELLWAGLLTDRGGVIRITDAGQAALKEAR